MADALHFDIAHAEALEGVPHGFFGHSAGKNGNADQFGYGGDGDVSVIRAARSEAAQTVVAGGKLAAPHQVHSPDVVTVTKPWDDDPEGRPVADAVVTSTPGMALGIVTADCAPVLFADREARVVGAAHAGWRGAHGGVLENTIAAMEALGASRTCITAAVGPTIAQASYEVDAPFRANFTEEDERHFGAGREGHWQFDLPGYVAARLAKSGIARVQLLDLDTFSNPERYYSYRRATQRGEANYGRQISMIALP